MKIIVAVCVLLTLSFNAFAGRSIGGTVKTVYDGDTVLLVTREHSQLKVRLYGIDAPETKKPDKPGQPYGDESKRALKEKIMGRRVTAEIIDVDQYKRTVAVIRCDGRDINREMVSDGMAWAYRHYLQGAYASQYIGEEERARSRRAGLWRDRNPQPPWEFRRGQKSGGRQRNNHWW
ncbi:MAG TPA: thermonuclease family protein [Desulfuromonadales bacterium]|nr:thermonuclease family protein [Desulfuromonadales bacterium]